MAVNDVIITQLSEPPDYTRVFDGVSTFVDRDAEAKSRKGTAFELWSDTNDIVYMGKDATSSGASDFSYVGFLNDTAGDYGTFTFEYADGVDGGNLVNSWATLTAIHNNTAGFSQRGWIAWVIPGAWITGKVDGQVAFWIRATVDAVTTTATAFHLMRSLLIQGPTFFDPRITNNNLIRDTNRVSRKRDVANPLTDHPLWETTQNATDMTGMNLMMDWRSARHNLYVENQAMNDPPSWSTDDYVQAVKGRMSSFSTGATSPHKMRPAEWMWTIDASEVTTIPGLQGLTGSDGQVITE